MRGERFEEGRGGDEARPPTLGYCAEPEAAGRGRFWAWVFLVSGLYALACAPGVMVFEALGWPEAALHLTSFAACAVCVVGAGMYLAVARREGGGRPRALPGGIPVRLLAIAAIALAGGFLLLVVGLVVMLSLGSPDL